MNKKKFFFDLLNQSVQKGAIRWTMPNDEVIVTGQDPKAKMVDVVVADDSVFEAMLSHGNLGLAEAYMDEKVTIKNGELYDLLIMLNDAGIEETVLSRPQYIAKMVFIRALSFFRGKHKNIHRHYDLGDDLFSLFLDQSRGYSCGYLAAEGDSSADMQAQKYKRICDKLDLKPGDRVLDIGCGYAGFLIYAAKHYGITGLGITISHEHHERGNEFIRENGLEKNIRCEYKMSHQVTGEFDKIVSIGMAEHLSRADYAGYFGDIHRLLAKHGKGLVHCIACNTKNNDHDPFIQKYIFAGSNLPKLSEMAQQLESKDMPILDVENVIRHYGYTGLHWYNDFEKNKGQLDAGKYDDRFKRMWKYYLACVVAGGWSSKAAVYQVLFDKVHSNGVNRLARV